MRSKIVAAEMAGAGGVPTTIAASARPGVVAAALAGEAVGTRFRADRRAVSSFKLWLRYGKPARGRLIVDAGARRALAAEGASLLPVGITAVEGSFAAGDGVDIAEGAGPAFAKGIAEASAAELRRLVGRRGGEPAVHRDYLVLLDAR
jgi:glutamate 5-kinase